MTDCWQHQSELGQAAAAAAVSFFPWSALWSCFNKAYFMARLSR
jgi:hypothetical protein